MIVFHGCVIRNEPFLLVHFFQPVDVNRTNLAEIKSAICIQICITFMKHSWLALRMNS